jgi:hypothetical protein
MKAMKKTPAPLITVNLLLIAAIICCKNINTSERYRQVSANCIENSSLADLKAIAVGNGNFSFSPDITGLQTFCSDELHGMKPVVKQNQEEGSFVPAIGLSIVGEDGNEISSVDIKEPFQRLDLLTGEIDSKFKVDGIPVDLKTVCHPDYDMVSVQIVSALLKAKRLKIKITYCTDNCAEKLSIFSASGRNKYEIVSDSQNIALLRNTTGSANHFVMIWKNSASIRSDGRSGYIIDPSKYDSVYSFTVQFLKDLAYRRVQTFGETEAASKKSWNAFWNTLDDSYFLRPSACMRKGYGENSIQSAYFEKLKLIP